MTDINLDELNEEAVDSLVFTGVDFVRCVTETFGAGTGMKVWDAMASAIGEDLRGRIFMSILTGDGDGNITIQGNRTLKTTNQFIPFIKLLRAATGYGLKEAKDVADEIELGVSKRIKLPMKVKQTFVKECRAIGVRIS